MYLSREKFDEIKKRHDTFILTEDDAEEALRFAWEVMIAEIDALKEKEPYATTSIDRMERSAYEFHELLCSIEAEEFSEGG